MRKIASFCIGALAATSRLPEASKWTTLPWRATIVTTPASLPSSTIDFIPFARRPSRSDDIPTDSGLAVGSSLFFAACVGCSANTHHKVSAQAIAIGRDSVRCIDVDPLLCIVRPASVRTESAKVNTICLKNGKNYGETDLPPATPVTVVRGALLRPKSQAL